MKKLEAVTQEQWNEVCEFNRNLVESFLSDSVELSPKSRKAYESNLKIWFVWVKDNLKNKKQIDIKPLEYKKFQNYFFVSSNRLDAIKSATLMSVTSLELSCALLKL